MTTSELERAKREGALEVLNKMRIVTLAQASMLAVNDTDAATRFNEIVSGLISVVEISYKESGE
ncbi:hypothetical protein [Leclercia sp. LSNIH1]|uniref:hypothetical protein n=1 Tax=Leclercia sp. LSNIH1 TaxID=1920114 RepID=UPI000CD06860|nr:hypothetical protein [Leclercia sp. LSNIH1]AUU82723.1 hypothetical protein C2U54_01220 [Leclercia sp. LSNIH1]POV34745.1 hypothetical protein C3388_09245 [Leclercia sp. LSNIH5]POW63055.1 hypothetical protein C3389_19925 [Leclercia sp. LSNIH2]